MSRSMNHKNFFRGHLSVAALVVTALVLPSAAAEVHVIEINSDVGGKAWDFQPADVEIAPGDTVRWVQNTQVGHTATSTDDRSDPSPNGLFDHSFPADPDAETATFEFTFDDAGTYDYYCKPHSSFMRGTITVASAGDGGDGGDGDDGDGQGGDESNDAPAVPLWSLLLVSIACAARLRTNRR